MRVFFRIFFTNSMNNFFFCKNYTFFCTNRKIFCRVYVRTSKGKEGWLPTSIVMQTLLSDENSAFSGSHRREDSTYRRE